MRHRTRTTHVLVLLLIVAVLLGLATGVSHTLAAGADVVIDWWSSSAGGGTGTSASFTLHASIGQPDAGAGTSESYTVTGGVLAGAVSSSATGEPQPTSRVFLPAVIK